MPATVLSKREFAINQCCFDWRKFRRSKIFLAEQAKHRTRSHGSHEASALIDPLSFGSLSL
jgi:hypothetical protein